jgi:purine-binding chemotaxis protein CheW
MAPALDRKTVDERQLVVFRLGDESYGVDIHAVREIIRMQPITAVPNAPAFIEGVTNLRGQICPVMDLRRRLAIEAPAPTADSRIVVVQVEGDDVGMMVDDVTEVLRIDNERISPAAALVSTREARLVASIANLDERLIIILDLAHLFGAPEASESAA